MQVLLQCQQKAVLDQMDHPALYVRVRKPLLGCFATQVVVGLLCVFSDNRCLLLDLIFARNDVSNWIFDKQMYS